MELILEDMRDYPQIIDAVMKWGQKRSPRGMNTLDAGLSTITVLRPDQCCLPLGIGRKLDPRIAAMEAIQLIAGRNDAEMMIRIAPQFKKYSNIDEFGDQYFHGGYGDRLRDSMIDVERKFFTDVDTRQAVVTIWGNHRDTAANLNIKDIPCTIALGFQIMNNVLEMNVLMRSSDAWLGIPYDIFQFSQLQATLAHVLDVSTGPLRLTTWSLHIYESNFDTIFNTQWVKPELTDLTYQPTGINSKLSMNQNMIRARRIMVNDVDGYVPSPSEAWYLAMLHNNHIASLGVRDVTNTS